MRFLSPKKRHVITVQTEHKCVLDSCRALQQEGFEVTYLPVNSVGLIDLAQLEAAIRPDTGLVSVMAVNNEIGTIQPLKAIGEICAKKGVKFHTDAAQVRTICDALQYFSILRYCVTFSLDISRLSLTPKIFVFLVFLSSCSSPLGCRQDSHRCGRAGLRRAVSVVAQALRAQGRRRHVRAPPPASAPRAHHLRRRPGTPTLNHNILWIYALSDYLALDLCSHAFLSIN